MCAHPWLLLASELNTPPHPSRAFLVDAHIQPGYGSYTACYAHPHPQTSPHACTHAHICMHSNCSTPYLGQPEA